MNKFELIQKLHNEEQFFHKNCIETNGFNTLSSEFYNKNVEIIKNGIFLNNKYSFDFWPYFSIFIKNNYQNTLNSIINENKEVKRYFQSYINGWNDEKNVENSNEKTFFALFFSSPNTIICKFRHFVYKEIILPVLQYHKIYSPLIMIHIYIDMIYETFFFHHESYKNDNKKKKNIENKLGKTSKVNAKDINDIVWLYPIEKKVLLDELDVIFDHCPKLN